MTMLGTVFNIQRFSLFDGPGVRTVVFLKGCPLRCRWCHNPEGISPMPQIMYDPLKCIGCGDCAAACGAGLHSVQEGLHTYNRSECTSCGGCAAVCVTGALSVAGKKVSVSHVMQEVSRDLPLYLESGGGVTVSGGEPLMQADFTLEILKAAKDMGISTCVETSGFGKTEDIIRLARYTDIFYYDCKATGDMHKELCGADRELILKNLAVIDSMCVKTVLRCPIVVGANDCDIHISGIGEISSKFDCIAEVHLEPYHKLGIPKSKKLGDDVLYDGDVPSREVMLEYCKRIEKISGKPTKIS